MWVDHPMIAWGTGHNRDSNFYYPRPAPKQFATQLLYVTGLIHHTDGNPLVADCSAPSMLAWPQKSQAHH